MAQEKSNNKARANDAWEDLVVSILSVNNYSLEQTYRLLPGLREQEVCSPSTLMRLDLSEVGKRLMAAGYNRGSFMTNQFALRLIALGLMIERKGLEDCARIIAGEDRSAIQELLLPVNGIGAKVISNFFQLRGI